MIRSPSFDHNRRASLRREITGIVLFKIAIILLAGFTIFGARHRLHVNTDLMSGHLLQGADPSSQPENR